MECLLFVYLLVKHNNQSLSTIYNESIIIHKKLIVIHPPSHESTHHFSTTNSPSTISQRTIIYHYQLLPSIINHEPTILGHYIPVTISPIVAQPQLINPWTTVTVARDKRLQLSGSKPSQASNCLVGVRLAWLGTQYKHTVSRLVGWFLSRHPHSYQNSRLGTSTVLQVILAGNGSKKNERITKSTTMNSSSNDKLWMTVDNPALVDG